ncbi:MAG: type II toxin-antitoxin system PemK/MazF family toxin [Bacteroidales bacterium]|nr:type II toxin-antitoxin system PemK/MazF family toxin [Bacteroidales bacterium]
MLCKKITTLQSYQYDIFWANLDPAVGHEIQKTRPCVIISPNELNKGLGTVLAAPLTSTIKPYPFRAKCKVSGKMGSIALDQIRCMDKSRLAKKMDQLSTDEISKVKRILEEMFPYAPMCTKLCNSFVDKSPIHFSPLATVKSAKYFLSSNI